MIKKIRSSVSNSNGGFTIVELIVAAVIMIIAVIAIVAVLRQGTELQVTDYHRRQARAIIMNIFEESFSYNQYVGDVGSYVVNVQDAKCNLTSGAYVCDAVIDERIGNESVSDDDDGHQPLVGNITVTVTADSADVEGGVKIGVHVVTATVRWTDVYNKKDSLSLTKQLTDFGSLFQ